MKALFSFILIVFSTLVRAQIITTIAGNGNSGFGGEGSPATDVPFSGLCGVGSDKYGNIYIAEWGNQVIEKIDINGILTRFAGTGSTGYGGDGGPATAAELELFLDVGFVADSIGNIYFTDGSRVRMVNTAGIITTVAGIDSLFGSAGDGGPATAAVFEAPTGICFDKAGNLYICDDEASNIRKVNTSGIISTFAGTTAGISGDGGPASNAQMISPEGIICDNTGYVYFADLNGRIRKIDTAGIITTIAGGGSGGGEGYPATDLQINGPIGVAVDDSGNVFFASIGDDYVAKVTPNGLVYAVAGYNGAGYNGDNIPAVDAKLNNPKMICLDNSGNLLITDPGNYRLRKVWLNPATSVPAVHAAIPQLSIYPNPVTNHYIICTITSTANEPAKIELSNVLGQVILTHTIPANTPTQLPINAPPGLYFITVYTPSGSITDKLIVE